MKLATIGICLDKDRLDFLQTGIEKVTGDGHHAFLVSDNTLGQEKIIESHANIGGVVEQPLLKYRDTVVLMLEPTWLTEEQVQDIVFRAASKIGCKYDFRNIVGHLLKWYTLNNEERFICSELVAYAYLLHVQFLGRDPRAVSPSDIRRHCVYLNTEPWNRFLLSDYYKGKISVA